MKGYKKMNMMNRTHWVREAKKLLLDRKIVGVSYLTKQEIEAGGWTYSGVILTLDDGTKIYPSSDDEGNNAGALFSTNKKINCLPVIR